MTTLNDTSSPRFHSPGRYRHVQLDRVVGIVADSDKAERTDGVDVAGQRPDRKRKSALEPPQASNSCIFNFWPAIRLILGLGR